MPRARKEEVKKQAASYNLSVTTNRLKGHLGASPSADLQQRDTAHSSAAGIADERLSEAQLVRKAQAIHDDTTATAERALRVVEESKNMKDATLTELRVQNRKLGNLNEDLRDVNETVTQSERLLRYMRRCCCCWMFDSCTGAEPEARAEREWQQITARNEYRDDDACVASQSGPSTRAHKRHADQQKAPPATFRNPDTNLGKGHESQASQLAKETHKQNKMLDQIGKGLDELMVGAQDIAGEVDEQDERIQEVQKGAEKTGFRIQDMSGKSQLRKGR